MPTYNIVVERTVTEVTELTIHARSKQQLKESIAEIELYTAELYDELDWSCDAFETRLIDLEELEETSPPEPVDMDLTETE